jgi:hypothetical protein
MRSGLLAAAIRNKAQMQGVPFNQVSQFNAMSASRTVSMTVLYY